MIRVLVSLLTLALALAPSADADTCSPTLLEVQGGRVYASYDPFLNQDTSVPVSLEALIGDCADQGINFEIVSLDNPLTVSERGYEIADHWVDFVDSQGRSFSRWALSTQRARARNETRVPLSDVFRVLVRRGQARPPGLHEGRFALRTLGADNEVLSERAFTVVLETVASVRVGSPTRIVDLGAIEAGERALLPMNTFGNVAYQIRVESERGWRLLGDGENAVAGEGVPYSMWLQNNRLDGGGAPVVIEPSANGYRPLELGIRIEPFTNQQAGLYRDFITIQIIPLS